jgi:histidinol phosphatase-like PHP family hydrolase
MARRQRRTAALGAGLCATALLIPIVWTLGVGPVDLPFVGGTAWLANEGEIVQVNGQSGRVEGALDVDGAEDIAVVQSDGVVVVEIDGELRTIDPALLDWYGSTAATGEVVVGEGSDGDPVVYLVEPAGTVRWLDPLSLDTLGQVDVNGEPGEAVVAGGRLHVVVSGSRDTHVLVIDGDRREAIVEIGEPGDRVHLTRYDAEVAAVARTEARAVVTENVTETVQRALRLVGHDWGGWIGFLLCLRLPERVGRYLALNTGHPFFRADPRALTDFFAERPWVAEVVARGSTKAAVVSHDGLRFDLRVVPPESYGNLLQHFTGSKAHNVALREEAVRRGLSISEYGVVEVESGETFTAVGEEELYAHLGYAWIPPELRENRGELEAARDGGLPRVVELSDLRGDLHMHTDWSDGRGTLEEMVLAAQARGHRYVAVCDHARRLRNGRLERQAEEIAALDETLSRVRVLSGIEVDIRGDGSLDMDDDALAERDWVMASIHAGFDQPRDRLTERLLAAMDNPHVDCIGHPTGRKINRRSPYELDWERVLEHAVATGTFLEINAQPDRLDLTDTHARAAAEAGVGIVISTDAHRVHELANLELGVAQARRGWIRPEQVVNTRSWRDVRRMLKS